MYTYFLLLFTIATANGNQPGSTVAGESINLSKNHAYVCCTVVTIVTANRNRSGTVDGESIDLIHSNPAVNGNQLGTVDGESINLSKNRVYVILLLP